VRIALASIGDPHNVNLWSGIPHSVLQQLQQQAESVHVIALKRDFRYLYAPAKLWHRFRGTQIQFDRHPLALRSFHKQIHAQLKGQKVDALLVTSSIPVTGLQLDIPLLFWTDAVFDAMVDYYPAAFTGLTAKEHAICHRQEQGALTSATYALYASDWAVTTAHQHYSVSENKTQVAEFGANLHADLTNTEAEALIDSRAESSMLHLLWVGVDWQRKGGNLALEATRLLNERGIPALLHVAGCASPPADYVRNYGFLNRSTTEGRAKLAELFSQASFFLFPTRAEAAGIVFAESCSFALPIVAAGTGGVDTYVLEGINGTLLPVHAEATADADAIEYLWNDRSRYVQLAQGALQQYRNRLNWGVSVQKALRLAAGKLA
jgi:glycosyltransferase involved in cell wall biosynthesis